jgi:hypothetical protein
MKMKDFRDLLNGQHWLFLCFTPARYELCRTMLLEIIVATDKALSIGVAQIPPAVLWNGEACVALTVPKAQLPAATLAAGLRKHLGYECPEVDSDVFTLGVTPEDDAALSRVGLFGRK